ncbi:MAG TPA: hypothetical protein VMS17_20925 [Gemmataceae bacterium]|nr:hypothetical protein [Gemmataceae bacterium]
MKVLQQLIQHFWQRGALTPEQAHYLVECGFVRAEDLPDYQPIQAEEPDDAAPAIAVLFPDELDQKQDELAGPTLRKAGRSTPRTPELTPERLGELLEEILRAREPLLPALQALSGADAPSATAALRQMPEEEFRRRLLTAVQTRPGVLAELWEAVDEAPFHDLLARPGMKGRPARAFGAVLRAADVSAWAAFAWIMQVPAVQTVANALAVRRRLRAGVLWLYDSYRPRLNRCLQRPAQPPASWTELAFGMVVVHNARAWPTGRKPTGFRVEQRLDADGWRAAWTAAMSLDPKAVTPFFLQFFGGVEALKAHDYNAENLAERAHEDAILICPYEWKV